MPRLNITPMHKFGCSRYSIVSQIPDGVRKIPHEISTLNVWDFFALCPNFRIRS